MGFFLNSLGYYLPIGEHFDVKTYFDYYTKGSWNFRPEVSYRKNYKYNGSFRGEIGTTIRGIKGLENYTKAVFIILHGHILKILKPIRF